MKKFDDLHDWVIARNKVARNIEKIRDPQERIDSAHKAITEFKEAADPSWITSHSWFSGIIAVATIEIEQDNAEMDEADRLDDIAKGIARKKLQ